LELVGLSILVFCNFPPLFLGRVLSSIYGALLLDFITGNCKVGFAGSWDLGFVGGVGGVGT
jgi:hypothetical protein